MNREELTTKRQQAADALANARWRTPGFCSKGHNMDKTGRRSDGHCTLCARANDRKRGSRAEYQAERKLRVRETV